MQKPYVTVSMARGFPHKDKIHLANEIGKTLCGKPWILKTGFPFRPKQDCQQCRKIQEKLA